MVALKRIAITLITLLIALTASGCVPWDYGYAGPYYGPVAPGGFYDYYDWYGPAVFYSGQCHSLRRHDNDCRPWNNGSRWSPKGSWPADRKSSWDQSRSDHGSWGSDHRWSRR